MPPFKDEHVLIIAPGSQITAAQLGLPESFTPPRYRFPTRMFPGLNPGEWEPVKIRAKTTTVPKSIETAPVSVPEPPPVANGEESKVEPQSDEPPKVAEAEGEQPKVEKPDDGAGAPPVVQVPEADQPKEPVPESEEAKEELPDAEQPKEELPDAEQPKDDKPESEQPKDEQPEAEQPKAEQPEIEPPKVEQPNGEPVTSVDVEMKEAPPAEDTTDTVMQTTTEPTTEEVADPEAAQVVEEETVETFEDDLWSTEGAVYPIQGGRIENWSCFFALLSHIYNMISPPFHMPVLFVSQPCWSARDHEMITQYVFENWKIPAFCLMDAALTACYAYGVPTALVLDVGHDKCDVTAVTEFQVNDVGRGMAIAGCGGRSMTKRLQQVLEHEGFDEDMAEQLKKSSICEILPAGAAFPAAVANGTAPNPAAAASTGAMDSGLNAKDEEGQRPGQAPRGPGMGTVVGEEGANGDEEEDEGVLDVAAIVARDNAAELLAKREREKAEKAAAKKGGAVEANRQMRLRNSERNRASFTYVDFVPVEELSAAGGPMSRKRKREIEVGVERFMAATPPPGVSDGIIDTITEVIHHTALSVPDIQTRSTLWDNLIIVGNGSRVRGFTSSLISVLNSRYVLSPSTATIFTSELPSNFTTPVATPGTNTPIPGQGNHPLHHPGGHGVNPLLVAATKNMMQPNQQHLQVPGQVASVSDPNMHHHHRGFSQSPTSIKTVKTPDYFPEWKDPSVSGMEEAAFLGAQVAAKVVFMVDQGNNKGFLTRSEYNDLGPAGIHECAM